MRIIEVDDALWGDLVGGVLICFHEVSSGEHEIFEISVECFLGSCFAEKDYLKRSREVAASALQTLRVEKGDGVEFHVCTGFRPAAKGFSCC